MNLIYGEIISQHAYYNLTKLFIQESKIIVFVYDMQQIKSHF